MGMVRLFQGGPTIEGHWRNDIAISSLLTRRFPHSSWVKRHCRYVRSSPVRRAPRKENNMIHSPEKKTIGFPTRK